MTPGQARLLLSPLGREAVQCAQQQDLSQHIKAAEVVRSRYGSDLGPLALEQALLRRRALAKHPRGDELWWTAEALEQASSYDVSVHRTGRYPGPVLDLGCSVGADLLALAARGPVVGVDLSETRLLLAQANARVLGLHAPLLRADLTQWAPPAGAAVFADPARRSGGRRVFDPRGYTPSLDHVLSWLPSLSALGVKVAPGIDYAALPEGLEVEIVSLRGEVKEAVLWGGAARRGPSRTATLLPAASTLTARDLPPPPVRPPGSYLLDLDGAVVRAHLVAEAAAEVDGALLDPTIAYVTADAPVPTPWGRWYEVLETLPFGLKALRERLRAHDAGMLVVKKRGTAVEPDELRRRLKLTGSREVTVVLTRSAGRQIAMVVTPLSAAGGRAGGSPRR